MNLRLSHNQLTFKITEEELRFLLQGQPLCRQLNVGATLLDIAIEPGSEDTDLITALDPGVTPRIRLTVAPALLRELDELGRDKDGLNRYNGDTRVTLQVDLRSRKPTHS